MVFFGVCVYLVQAATTDETLEGVNVFCGSHRVLEHLLPMHCFPEVPFAREQKRKITERGCRV